MRRIALLALLLCGCSGDLPSSPPAQAQWEIGPTIGGKNYSTGSISGNVIQVADVHYVTRPTGPLAGTISVSFSLSAPLRGAGCPGPASASLYFQRKGDDWNTDGARWWATFATVTLDHAGSYTMTATLNPTSDKPWTSVKGGGETSANAPADFANAKANAARVGFTLGNCTGYGHGATGPAILTITDFSA